MVEELFPDAVEKDNPRWCDLCGEEREAITSWKNDYSGKVVRACSQHNKYLGSGLSGFSFLMPNKKAMGGEEHEKRAP